MIIDFIHYVLQEIIKGLPRSLKIVDLSAVSFECIITAFHSFLVLSTCILQRILKFSSYKVLYDIFQDFRLRDVSEYEEWYGQPHIAPDLQVIFFHQEIAEFEDPESKYMYGFFGIINSFGLQIVFT